MSRILAASSTRRSISSFGVFLQLQAERDVLEHAHVRVERVVLEHHGDVAVLRRHVVHDVATDRDLAAGDFLQPRDHAQRGRLAAARRADQHDEFLVGHFQVDNMHDRMAVIGLANLAQAYRGHEPPRPGRACTWPGPMHRHAIEGALIADQCRIAKSLVNQVI
jgi:hypothetical protein